MNVFPRNWNESNGIKLFKIEEDSPTLRPSLFSLLLLSFAMGSTELQNRLSLTKYFLKENKRRDHPEHNYTCLFALRWKEWELRLLLLCFCLFTQALFGPLYHIAP